MGALGVGKNSRGMRAGRFIGAFCAVGLVATPVAAAGVLASEPIMIADIPVDFILFALTLLGVALFHHHTLQVALTGLAAITLYKLGFTGFKYGTGLPGLAEHMSHEAVILSNLFLLLMGFAILSRHFENSRIPDEMPALLPNGWGGGLVPIITTAVWASTHDLATTLAYSIALPALALLFSLVWMPETRGMRIWGGASETASAGSP